MLRGGIPARSLLSVVHDEEVLCWMADLRMRRRGHLST
jgi:hypothetical protein